MNTIQQPTQFKLESLLAACLDNELDIKRATVLVQCCGPDMAQGVGMAKIAKACRFSKAAATGLVDKMVQAKLVKTFSPRTKEEGDRRAVYVRVTDEGKRVLRRIRDQAAEMDKQSTPDIPFV